MQPIHYDADLCIMTKFSSLISGKWKPIILFLVEHKVNRFSQMQAQMPTISKKVLTEQLRELETDGLISREELKTKAPKVVVYHLSEKGASLRKLLDEIISWSLQHMREKVPHDVLAHFVQANPGLCSSMQWMKQEQSNEPS